MKIFLAVGCEALDCVKNGKEFFPISYFMGVFTLHAIWLVHTPCCPYPGKGVMHLIQASKNTA